MRGRTEAEAPPDSRFSFSVASFSTRLELFGLRNLKETLEANVEVGGMVQAEPTGIAIFSIALEEKCMVDDVWMFCEERQMQM